MRASKWERIASALSSVLDHSPEFWSRLLRDKLPAVHPSWVSEAKELASLELEGGGPFEDRVGPCRKLLEPGTVLRERYIIGEHLGSGGMCDVYRADDTQSEESIAVKFLAPEYASDPYLLALLRRELRIGRSIHHPNVCRIYGIDEAIIDGQIVHFIVMELLDGFTLEAKLEAGSLPLEESESIINGILDGLEAAHNSSILHGDLKCANVIMAHRPSLGGLVPVLTDFGLSRRLGPTQKQSAMFEGKILGTAAYMPPEQFRGDPLTAASDLYAAGVILFRMTTGQFPFDGGTWHRTAAMRLSQSAVPARSLVANLPLRIDRCIASALDAQSANRPQNTEEFRLLLSGERLSRLGSERRRLALAAAGIVLGIGSIWRVATVRKSPDSRVFAMHLQLANEFLARRNPEGFEQAQREFDAALRLDPKSAEAWTGLAELFGAMSNWGYARPSAALPKGRDAALNAIRINPDFARAHGILGYLTSIDVRHWLEASPHFQLALRLAPDDPRIRFWYATHLGRLGQHTEAISHLRFAREANPQLFAVGHQLAYEYQRAGRNGEFLDQAKELVRVQPQDSLAQLTLCRALIDNDNLAEARKALREAEHFRAPAPQLWFTRAVIAAAEGAPNRVSEAARELARLAEEGPVDSSLVAGAHVLAGDPAAALGYLRAGLARGDSTVLTAHAQTVFAGLKGSPEFKNFLRSTGWSLPPVK